MKTKLTLTVCFLVLIVSIVNANPPEMEGKNIFMSRCAACHNITKQLTGPALTGIDERRSIDWIISFIQSSQSLIKSGDADAVALFEKFNKVPMPDHKDLTADNIKSVLAYIKSQSRAGGKPVVKNINYGNYKPLSIKKDYAFFLGYFVVVIMLIMALLFAVQSNNFQRRMRGKNYSG